MATLTIAIEGLSDAAVVRRLVRHGGHLVGVVHDCRGKGGLGNRLGGFNSAARYAPWFVVRDLNSDYACAPLLLQGLLPNPARYMMLRVAVREIEAWLLGDRKGIARYLAISEDLIPTDPESEPDPKQLLVNLARRSRRRDLVADIVPAVGTTSLLGPGYISRISEFAESHWDVDAAANVTPSLASALRALRAVR